MRNAISGTVQFNGADAVISAYSNRNVAPWSLWAGKQFLFKYEGSDMGEGANNLMEILDALANGGSPAVYTLCVYEKLEAGKIKSNTAHDGSFNFRLTHPNQVGYPTAIQSRMSDKALMDEIQALRAEIAVLKGEDDDDDDPDDEMIGRIERIMRLPGVQNIVSSVVGMFSAKGAAPASVAGVPCTGEGAIAEYVAIMATVDPDIEVHLQKLAALAQSDPGRFKMLVGMIDQL